MNLPDSRGRERYRLAFLATAANVASKSMSMLVMLASVAWTIPYLGADRFGVWMTVASLAGVLGFMDLGVANALTNRVAQCIAEGDEGRLRRVIAGGMGALAWIALLVYLALEALLLVLPWEQFVGSSPAALTGELAATLHVFAALFSLQLWLSGAHRVAVGMQKGYLSHLSSLTTSAISLGLLWWAASQRAEIHVLLSITMGLPALSGMLLLLNFQRANLFRLRGLRAAMKSESGGLIRTGGVFFVLQIGTMVGWGSDSLIIASALGAAHVATFNIVQRLFQFVIQPLTMVNAPLWAAYADAHYRKDGDFIRKTLRRSLIGTVLFALVVGGGLALGAPWLIEKWTGHAVNVPPAVIWLFFVWTLCDALGGAVAVAFNGCAMVWPQVRSVIVLLVLGLSAKLYFAKYGLEYLLLASIISYFVAVPLYYYLFERPAVARLFAGRAA